MALPMGTPNLSSLITARELAVRLQGGEAPLIIDVREPHEYASGHIPGARNLPLSSFTATFRQLPQDREIILVCRSDNRSGMAQRFLMHQGYSATRNLIDGMLGWTGPITKV